VQGVYIAGQFKFVITGPLESLLYLEIKFNWRTLYILHNLRNNHI
jgi:hypothetical protein